MFSKTFLAQLSQNIAIGVAGINAESGDHSFGGINVILCGDFHQFPPVATPHWEALYQPISNSDTPESQLGQKIYEEFTTVVLLKEQMQVTHPTWHDLLDHLQYGHIQEHHICMLKELVIGHPKAPTIDFSTQPWSNACLITPRHAVRKLWNEAAARKWCQESGEQLFICQAEDSIKGRPLMLCEHYALAASAKGTDIKKEDMKQFT
jgi:hypothetical protein